MPDCEGGSIVHDDFHDDYWALREDDHAVVPIAELSHDDKRAPRDRRRRTRRWAATFLLLSLLGGAAIIGFHVSNGGGGGRTRTGNGPRRVRTIGNAQARLDVLGALHATTAVGSFTIHSTITESPGSTPSTTASGACGSPAGMAAWEAKTGKPVDCSGVGAGGTGLTITADSTVNVDPIVLVSTADVPGVGQVTTRVNGNAVWEAGGANYGLNDGVSGPGAPLSQFASLAVGTLGPREGAVAMNSLASPTGYLQLAEQEITDASSFGEGVVDGVAVHEYLVDVDAHKVLDRPGLTAEETKTARAALALLEQQGYRTTTVRLSIDANGFVRRTQTSVRFGDGGTVDADAQLSGFGCSTTSLLPSGPAIVPNPAGCAPAGAAAPPSTTP